jgi:hypothetical protein
MRGEQMKNMKARYLAVFAAVIAIVTFVAVHAHGGKPSAGYNVTTTISSSAGGPLFLQSDYLLGGGSPTYTATANIVSSIGWEYFFDLSQQTSRSVYLDLSVLTPNGTSPTISALGLTPGYYYARIWSRCYTDATGNTVVSLLQIPAGTSLNTCSLRINFAGYSLAMAPPAEVPSGAPANGRALVSCKAQDSSGCNSWTIVQDPTNPNGTSADLIESTRRGNVVVGSYSGDTFRIDLQR